MNWRIIPYSENDAFLNMAIDEAVGESVAAGAQPTIRFYGWKPSAVSIGYFQSLEQEVDLKRCSELGVDFVRRRTGGGAVYHDNVGEITYSVMGKQEMFPSDILASYRLICGWICDSLASLGMDAEFKPINDIAVAGKKISGNAQTRRGGVLLQHGTVLHSVDVDRMFSVLRVSDEKIKDKMIANVKERVTSITQQKPDVSRALALHALVQGFTKGKQFETGQLTPAELARAGQLAAERYLTDGWNCMR
ncbi:MAG: biotin/lipoate A/B protein ligase family protein [Candidatus ainarchaeum sp.]|nr:biotin/lipoate A/B protein ligase family protein [Candidatus ainarchaeum sp.]